MGTPMCTSLPAPGCSFCFHAGWNTMSNYTTTMSPVSPSVSTRTASDRHGVERHSKSGLITRKRHGAVPEIRWEQD